MTDVVTLTVRAPITAPLDAAGVIAPDRLAALGEGEIASMPLRSGRVERPLGEWFDVRGGRSSRVRVVGDVRHVEGLGAGMTGGVLTVDGDAGPRTGAGMADGLIAIHGSAADDLGVAMTGGGIHVRGAAGDRVGAAEAGASRGMSGGEIIIGGSAGTDVGARMRRGLIFVGGNAGGRAGRAMIAGSVIVVGDAGAEPACGSKRGSLVIGGTVDVPATYRYACTYHAPHVRLALIHISRRYGLSVDVRFFERPYRRFSGDAGTVGRGEILWLT